MRQAIIELLPEINWVKDVKLSEDVITCHIDALNKGIGSWAIWIRYPLHWYFQTAPHTCNRTIVCRWCLPRPV